MTALIILGFLAVGLFALTYLTKRRFGVLGLALLAGSYLASTWTDTLTPAVANAGVTLVAPPLQTVVSFALTLLPALLLFLSSPTYHGKRARLLGALAFSLFAVVLLIEPLTSALVVDSAGKPVFEWIKTNYALLVTAGLVLAILDLFLARGAKHHKSGGKH